MYKERPYSRFVAQLRSVGLRPTRQRLALAKLLFNGNNRHVTAEALYREALKSKISVSLPTVYSTLHLFTETGLLKEIVVDSVSSFFDTNITNHHHFFVESTRQLVDIDSKVITFENLPGPPVGMEITGLDVIVRVKSC